MHPILDSGREESQATFQVPAIGSAGDVTCMALSAHFLILGTATGVIQYYHCQEKALLNKFKHNGGSIVQVFPQPSGTRYIICAESCAWLLSDCTPAHAIDVNEPFRNRCRLCLPEVGVL